MSAPIAKPGKPDKLVTLGRISGLFSVKGWVKVQSYTEPRDNIAQFGVWIVRRRGTDSEVAVEEARGHGSGVVAKLRGVDDREVAREWIGAEIAVARTSLPPCAPGEYYWTDLEGLEVKAPGGEVLGTVDHLIATGSHDVLVLGGEPQRLIPFVLGQVIRTVDLEAGVIVADWSAEA